MNLLQFVNFIKKKNIEKMYFFFLDFSSVIYGFVIDKTILRSIGLKEKHKKETPF